jgi:biotin-dependent carboxylase-like uncharacterized protein
MNGDRSDRREAHLRVLKPGPFSTFQDLGRHGRGHQGVARSGAFDMRAHQLANRLVGNERWAATIEILLGPSQFAARHDVVVAVTGTDAMISIDEATGKKRSEGVNSAFHVRDGERITIHSPTIGLRTYLSVRGGFNPSPVLGSRSFDSLGNIGPTPLREHDDLPIDSLACNEAFFETVPTRTDDRDPKLPFYLGPRQDWLSSEALKHIELLTWTIDAASNRTGVRFGGPTLDRLPGELASEAMIPGAIQLPANGLPIILGPDGGTTGGYPVIGVLTDEAMCSLAQKRPGQIVQLKIVHHND